MSLKGNYKIGFINIINDASFNRCLFVNSDAIFGNNVVTTNKVNTKGDVAFSNRLLFNSNSNVNNNLFNTNTITATGDVSLNNRLFVGNDISFGGNVTISKNLNLIKSTPINFNYNTTNYVQAFVTDISLNNRLFVGGNILFNGKVYVNNPIRMVGDVSINNRVFVNTIQTNNDISINSTYLGHGPNNISTNLFMCIVNPGAALFQTINANITTGNNNTCIGTGSGSRITTGNSNTIYASLNAGRNITTGSYNTAAGFNTIGNVSNGSYNCALGFLTMAQSNQSYNTGVGYDAGDINVSTSLNTSIGTQALLISSGIAYQTTTCIGASTVPSPGVTINAVVLGTPSETIYIQKNLMVLNDISVNGRFFVGNDASFGGNLYISKNLGINTSTPQYNLDVSGTVRANNLIYVNRFSEQIQNATTTTFDYNTGSVFYIANPGSSNFTANFINIPTVLNQSYIIRLIIKTDVNTVYANAVTVSSTSSISGTTITPYYYGGVSSISVNGSMDIEQTIEIINTSVAYAFCFVTTQSYK